jgi:flagellar basal-body rod protein FlgC
MNLANAMATSASGLDAQRLRMDVIASNLANVHSTRTPQGGPYRRRDVVFATAPYPGSFNDLLRISLGPQLQSVQVIGVVEDPRALKTVYDPQHPDADEQGYVTFPNVTVLEEMVNLISATRSYEANVTALAATKNMALKALEIGRP